MNGETIQIRNGSLWIPENPVISFIEGDYSGVDIWATTRRVVDVAVEKIYSGQRVIFWNELYIQDKAEAMYGAGCCLPKKTLTDIKKTHIVLKSSVSPTHHKPVKCVSQEIIHRLDLYATIIPLRLIPGIGSILPSAMHPDIVVFRENQDFFAPRITMNPANVSYQKLKKILKRENILKKIADPRTSEYFILPVSELQTKKIIRVAINYAMAEKRNSIAIVHKSRNNKKMNDKVSAWIRDVVRYEFPDITILGEDCGNNPPSDKLLIREEYTKDFFEFFLSNVRKYDIIVSNNYLADSIAALVASIVGGFNNSFQININPEREIYIYEPVKPSQPKYAGLDKANPVSLLFAACEMLRKMGWSEVSEKICSSMESVLLSRRMPYELAIRTNGATELNGTEFANEIIKNL